MPDDAYLFIDGGYLRRISSEAMEHVYGVKADLDLQQVKRTVNAFRMFYYDCLDDVQREHEPEDEFKVRVKQQETEFDAIQAIPGCHLRLGSLSGKRPKLRQKKVDVLLTVEALDHSLRRNMSRAFLLAGDLDFAPLVEALVRHGTYTHVMYEKTSGARDLYAIADVGIPITWGTLHNWNSEQFKVAHPHPGIEWAPPDQPVPPKLRLVRTGAFQGHQVQLFAREVDGKFVLMIDRLGAREHTLRCVAEHDAILEGYFQQEYGEIIWKR